VDKEISEWHRIYYRFAKSGQLVTLIGKANALKVREISKSDGRDTIDDIVISNLLAYRYRGYFHFQAYFESKAAFC
jgi:hypothetical protein